jgi:hypothetical protein
MAVGLSSGADSSRRRTRRSAGAHWTLMAALVVARVIEVMKPASLGVTVPGMIKEYQTTRPMLTAMEA